VTLAFVEDRKVSMRGGWSSCGTSFRLGRKTCGGCGTNASIDILIQRRHSRSSVSLSLDNHKTRLGDAQSTTIPGRPCRLEKYSTSKNGADADFRGNRLSLFYVFASLHYYFTVRQAVSTYTYYVRERNSFTLPSSLSRCFYSI